MQSDGFRIGRIAGIPVTARASVLFIVAVLTFGLAEGVLPEAGGLSPTGRWLVGLGGAVLFLGSLLAHEAGHALAAQRSGLRVEVISLWFFGGVARLSTDAPDARTALRIAAAGPVVSIAVTALSLGAGFALDAVGAPAASVAVLVWLGTINGFLAVFNLLPGLPLDGGRILQAALWRRHGDPDRATITAAGAGRFVGTALIGVGVFQFVNGGFGGLWTVLIGWMLSGAATVEGQSARTRRGLAGVRVGAVMTRDPVAVAGWTTVEDFAAGPAAAEGHGAYPLRTWDGRPDGLLLSARLRGVVDRTATLRSVAVPLDRVDTATPDEDLVEVLLRLRPFAEGYVVVVEDGRIVGVVSPGDVRRAVEGWRRGDQPAASTARA
jgi:Zn-dependent protease